MRPRLATLDADRGFVRALVKRLPAAAWEHRLLAAPVAPDALVAMRIDAVLVDAAALADPWAGLEPVRGRLPALGAVVCVAPSGVRGRVRGLRLGADDWVTKPATRTW